MKILKADAFKVPSESVCGWWSGLGSLPTWRRGGCTYPNPGDLHNVPMEMKALAGESFDFKKYLASKLREELLLVIGGYCKGHVLPPDVEVYLSETDSWHPLPSLNMPSVITKPQENGAPQVQETSIQAAIAIVEKKVRNLEKRKVCRESKIWPPPSRGKMPADSQ